MVSWRLPLYNHITKVTGRMKASCPPCPINKISIIPFTRFPFLHSYITQIFHINWQSSEISCVWKKARTVLIHMDGDRTERANVRPIPLQSFPLKIFISCLRDSVVVFITTTPKTPHAVSTARRVSQCHASFFYLVSVQIIYLIFVLLLRDPV